jgi:hypothetical protein
MASFNTGIRLSEVMSESDKARFVVVKNKDGAEAPYHLSKKLTEWKSIPGADEPVLFAQTWYARQIGLAQ